MASLIPPGRKFSLVPPGCLTSGILPSQRSTLSGCFTTAILSGRHPHFLRISHNRHYIRPTSQFHPDVSQLPFYPADTPLSPYISPPQFYPTDVPPSPYISHPALVARWERRTIQLPRADMSGSFDNAYPDSICGQRFILHQIGRAHV